jgi:hypothetical protein
MSVRFYFLINTNELIYFTQHPNPPPQGGRVRVGVMSLCLLRLY